MRKWCLVWLASIGETDLTRHVWIPIVVGVLPQVRVVRSAKDRSFEAIRTSVVKIRNHIKINDWNGIQADFDECNKHVDKSKVCTTDEIYGTRQV